jgi:itaconate CoA-transferase
MAGSLDGVLVVSIDQAVAAPYCAARLADAGARVIKIERPGGDFARHYDAAVKGQSAYFVWLNRGKQSVQLDFKNPDDMALLKRLIAKADVFIQNMAPGASERLGLGAETLRKAHPRLIVCDITGYGDFGPYRDRRAYDLLVQAESGVASITGTPEAPGRIGVSATDIGTGMYAHAAILEALYAREKTGEGRAIHVSLFSSMAEWMTVPLLHKDYAGYDWPRVGLTHPSISPYGVYPTREGTPLLISIQNDAEFQRLCASVLGQPDLPSNPDFATNKARNARRGEVDRIVGSAFAARGFEDLCAALDAAQIAYARVSSVADMQTHPQLRRATMDSPGGEISVPALAATIDGSVQRLGRVPALGEHTEAVRAEFAA